MDAGAVFAILILVGFILGVAELLRFILPKIFKPIFKPRVAETKGEEVVQPKEQPSPRAQELERHQNITFVLLIVGVGLLVLGFMAVPPAFVFGILVLLFCLGYYQRNVREQVAERDKEIRDRKEWEKPYAQPSAEQTKQAVLQLRLAKQRIESVFETKGRDNQYQLLSDAQLALKKASQLDRNASFHDNLFNDVPMTFTFDYLGGELYHCYGLLTLRQAEADWKAWVDVDQDFSQRQKQREFRKDQKKLHDEAEKDAKRAVEFQPENVRHMHLLTRIYIAAKKYKEARELLAKAQSLQPDNLDTVALMNELPS